VSIETCGILFPPPLCLADAVDRSAALPLIALLLAGYGLYTALYLPGLLVGSPAPLLLMCFIAQVVFALAAAVGVWRDQRWAAAPVLLLGASIVATQLIEVLLGIVPMLRAVLIAVLALVAAFLVAAYVRGRSLGMGDLSDRPFDG
jgi:hypothetical protein